MVFERPLDVSDWKKSLDTNVFSSMWKQAFVQHVVKKIGPNDLTNYRPVSSIFLISYFSKLKKVLSLT